MQTEEIILQLKRIEKEQNVRILFAAESGSRAWGFASPDSDWDVRFVYVRPLDFYLSIHNERDVIEVSTDDGFDAAGWDIRKAFQLLRQSNMALYEWLTSPIIYIKNRGFCKQLIKILPQFLNPKRAAYHYFHLSENHQNHYLEKRGVELKRFLYFLRGLLACEWIIEKKTYPPILFSQLVNATVHDEKILSEIAAILALKAESREHDKEPISETLQEFGKRLQQKIESQLEEIEARQATAESIAELNRILCETIKNG